VKTAILSAAIAMLMAAAAHAQVVVVEETGKRRWGYSSSGCGTYGWGGYGVGYGYGYGYGYGGFGTGFSGYGYSTYQGPLVSGGYGYGGLYGGAGYYGGYGGYGYRGGYFSRPSASTDAAGPLPRTGPVSDRMAEFTSARDIDDGRVRLKSGDYRGAVDQFRAAVAAHTENPVAQAWFAVALAISGDGKNADKALRAAAVAGFPLDRVTLADGFRDDKERAKVTAALARVSGDGAFAAAFALSLAGEGDKLKQLAEKDPAAKRLLPK
jgi:hypothetical protein